MEGSIKKPGVSVISKKSRSLDLQSKYVAKSRKSAGKSRAEIGVSGMNQKTNVLKRKRGFLNGNRGSDLVESRRKRSRKEVHLRGSKPLIKRRRNRPNSSRLKPNGFVSGIAKPENPSSSPGASRNFGGSTASPHNLGNGFASSPVKKKVNLSLSISKLEKSNGLGENIVIPKRPRGISRRKKSDSSSSLKKESGISTYSGDAQAGLLSPDVLPPLQALICKQKESDEVIKNGSSIENSIPHCNGESVSSVKVSRIEVPSRKRQESTSEKQSNVENEPLLVEDDEKFYENFQEYDEENLEQNAARMLSSRFDPRCTGFSGNRMTSSEPVTESFVLRSGHGNFMESASVDAAGRVLRPRKRNNKGFSRKRRHFYEVCYMDMDPYWVVKQRIKIFWPLDKSWYLGLVKDYDPLKKLHHVKYDDRDEEWINLQNERFKLLLFPSEVTSKIDYEKSGLEVRQRNEGDKNAITGNSFASLLESEPIISWLTQSTRRVKSLPFSNTKKQSRAHISKHFEPSILLAENEHMTVRPSSMISNKLTTSCVLPERSIDGDIAGEPVMKSRTASSERKLTFVYFRKRFRKGREGLDNKLEGSSASGSLCGPISLPSSVARSMEALEELNFIVTPMELKQVILKLVVPIQCIHDLAFRAECFWLCSTLFLLQYGKLMPVWPTVHLKIDFVDNFLGLKFLSFEGCLRIAVALVCLILTTFHQHNEFNKFSELRMPFTSIGFKLSCFQGQGRQLFLVSYRLSEVDASKWRYLEYKFKQYGATIRDIPLSDCTYTNAKKLWSRSGQLPFTSIFEEPLSLQVFSERSCSDIMHWLIPKKSAYLSMNTPVCYFTENYGRHPLCPLSFAIGPPFVFSLHLKSLMEKNATSASFQGPYSMSSQKCPEDNDKLTSDGCSLVEDSSDKISEVTLYNLGSSLGQAAARPGCLSFGQSKVETGALSVSNGGDWMRFSHDFVKSKVSVTGNSVVCGDVEKNARNNAVRSPRLPRHTGGDVEASFLFPEDSSSADKYEGGQDSCLNVITDQSQLVGKVEEGSLDSRAAQSASNLVQDMGKCSIRSPNTTGPRSIWSRNRHSSVSPTFGHHPKLWPEDFIRNGFVNGSRKPRTRVSYSLPFVGYDLGSKSQGHHRKRRPYKKIKPDNAKRISGGSGSPQSYLESFTCDANVLVTVGDRGWRECGAQVVLDSDDRKDWMISIKLSGATKYVHKAHQFLQPGTTNRYTHAMMWKGGKDWTLEFTDRSQWSLFKEMHEECYNRNIRAACIKNIPIPGVRLIEDDDENIVEVPFVRSSLKYFQLVGTEVDMAMDPSHVLYDMDSGDEEWISNVRNSLDGKGSKMSEVTDDIFERVMDMFEKFAYAQQCDEFTSDEIEEFMSDVGPLDIIKAIHEHWRQKRQKKGMPLIRQLQPPLWEHYQQQIREWELAMSKLYSSSEGCQDRTFLVEKPPMFAFCLRPRGLEAPNKGLKQRSHRKFTVTGHQSAFARERDGLHTFGRKLNGFSVGEKALVAGPNYESFDSFHWLHSSSSFSPRDSASTGILTMSSDSSDSSYHVGLYRNKSKKTGIFPSPRDSQLMSVSCNQTPKGNGVRRWSAGICELPGTQQSYPDGFQRQRADIDEFRLRDASSAAQHASNMAKLKREKAQWLLHKADLALHKAMVALMTAEAIKTSEKDLIGDG